MKIRLKCDAYVDQNRYIDNDPVGYKCMNDAYFESVHGIMTCADCTALWYGREGHRLTFIHPFGKEYQEKLINDLIDKESKK